MNVLEQFKNCEELRSIKKQTGLNVVPSRFGHIDMAYPCSLEEYVALWGCVVAMIGVVSEDKDEVPIKRAYFKSDYVELCPMRQLNVCIDGDSPIRDQVQEVKTEEGKIYFQNISFWAFKLAWFDSKWEMGVDFKINREKFCILKGADKGNSRIQGWVDKEQTNQIKLSEKFDDNPFGQFIQREFFKDYSVK